jgi:hypothetical protein
LFGVQPEINVPAGGFGVLLPKLISQPGDLLVAWLPLLNHLWHH